ncbi:MAG: tetratricopeptide repeat protein [Thermodesulfobacteriota bacterium]|nr:tetratricopeptide repeat protein [Thermodesulfobacteriota bacterium]
METGPRFISNNFTRLFFLFFIVLLIGYGNTFHASWHLDDKPNILNNSRIQITEISLDQLWQSMNAMPGTGGFYRPVACATFALNWFVGKKDVFGYHMVNFAIHLGTTWFLFLTIIALFSTPRLTDQYPSHQIVFIASLSSLLWALNPVQTQAVTYIVQRMASLAGMFSVLAILFYLRARLNKSLRYRFLFFFASAIFYLLGLLSKENVVILPLSIPVVEFLFFHDHSKPVPLKKTLAYVGLIICFCLTVIYLMKPNATDFILNYYVNRPFTLKERILTEPRIVLFYLSQIFFPAPSRLSVEHDITLSSTLISPWTTIPAIVAHIFLLFISIKLWRKQPLVSLSILFFYLNHMIESTIVPLELLFEHRNYLPSVFLFLPIAQVLNAVIVKIGKRKSLIALATVLISLVLGIETYATHTRNKVWRTEKSLWLDALAKAPGSARPRATLAIMLAWGENPSPFKYRKALELTKQTLSLRMNRNYEAEQLGNIASIYDKLGQNEKALEYYDKALKIDPNHSKNRFNLAKTLVRHGDFSKAVKELEVILSKGGLHVDYYGLLGYSYLWLGDSDKALPLLWKALKLAPGYPKTLLYIGNCMSSLGHYDRAQWFLKLAEKKGGHEVIVSLNLIQNALLNNDLPMAKKTLKRMLESFPLPLILKNLKMSEERYKNVPIDHFNLTIFLASEIKQLNSF